MRSSRRIDKARKSRKSSCWARMSRRISSRVLRSSYQLLHYDESRELAAHQSNTI